MVTFGLAFGASLLKRQLAGDAECVAQLRLARAELAKNLGDRASLDSALEQTVELAGAGRQETHVIALLLDLLPTAGMHGVVNTCRSVHAVKVRRQLAPRRVSGSAVGE